MVLSCGVSTIAVVGPGAVGAVVASELLAAGRAVRLCARTGFAELIHEVAGQVRRRAVSVELEPDGAGPVDWILLATKSHQTGGAAGWLRALCGPATRVAALQNGVDHVERLASLVPAASVVPVVVSCPATPIAPGHVRQHDPAALIVPDDEGGRDLAALFAGTAIAVTPTADWLTAAWTKLVSNAMGGALTALTGRRNEVFADPGIADLALRLGAEAVAVGRASGARLADELPGEVLARLRGSPDRGNSMLTDRLRGRPLEIEARNAVVCRAGRAHGVATPASDAVVAPLRALAPLPGSPGRGSA